MDGHHRHESQFVPNFVVVVGCKFFAGAGMPFKFLMECWIPIPQGRRKLGICLLVFHFSEKLYYFSLYDWVERKANSKNYGLGK